MDGVSGVSSSAVGVAPATSVAVAVLSSVETLQSNTAAALLSSLGVGGSVDTSA